MPLTYLQLAYEGNYIGRVHRLEYWTYQGRVYVCHQQQQDVIQETSGRIIDFAMRKNSG